ncbi:MAG: hypothetical protein LBI62_00735 [Candidatus Accumulibacter sp.]|nr:hypothetical protein [Accumulibacter sp.]
MSKENQHEWLIGVEGNSDIRIYEEYPGKDGIHPEPEVIRNIRLAMAS